MLQQLSNLFGVLENNMFWKPVIKVFKGSKQEVISKLLILLCVAWTIFIVINFIAHHQKGQMQTVTIDKQKFHHILQDNRAAHIAAFEEATQAFYKALNEELGFITEAVKEQSMNFQAVFSKITRMDCPAGHCDDYDRVIDELQHEVGDTVTLTSEEFQQYVKDNWRWKESFRTSYVSNTGKSLQ